MSNVKEWINDELHNLIGFTDKYTVEFLMNLAIKSVTPSGLIEKIRDTGTLNVNSDVVQFANDLWDKVPHAEIKEKPARAKEREMTEIYKKNLRLIRGNQSTVKRTYT